MLVLSPSLLSARLGMLTEEVTLLHMAGIPWVHWDIMDGSYVPNITFGAGLMQSVRNHVPNIFFDAHLMIQEPERHIPNFIQAGADLIVIHADTTHHPQRVLDSIRKAGLQCGVALNPHEHPYTIEYLLPYIDVILVMSVNPGFSGQHFLPSSIEKIHTLHELIQRTGYSIRIQVDGGVSLDNIAMLHDAGASIFVSGSSFFSNITPSEEAYKTQYHTFIEHASLIRTTL